MEELSAPALGRGLLGELTRLRTETLVAGGRGASVVDSSGSTAAGPPNVPAAGELPPTNTQQLLAAVRGRFTGAGLVEAFDATADLVRGTVDEVGARRAEALALLDAIDSRTGAQRGLLAGSVAPPAWTAEAEPHIDQNEARQLARHWELGERPVACRMLAQIDGDVVTQFPAKLTQAAGISYDSLVRAHSAVSLAALTMWPALFLATGRLVAAFIPQRPSPSTLQQAWRRAGLFLRQHATFHVLLNSDRPPTIADREIRFTRKEMVSYSRSFFGWGRVVFESPTEGSGALIRSMVHPSGDIATTVLQEATDDELAAHSETVVRWVHRMALSLQWLSRWLRWAPVATWLALSGVAFAVSKDLIHSLAWSLAFALVSAAAKLIAQKWLQHKLTALVSVPKHVVTDNNT